VLLGWRISCSLRSMPPPHESIGREGKPAGHRLHRQGAAAKAAASGPQRAEQLQAGPAAESGRAQPTWAGRRRAPNLSAFVTIRLSSCGAWRADQSLAPFSPWSSFSHRRLQAAVMEFAVQLPVLLRRWRPQAAQRSLPLGSPLALPGRLQGPRPVSRRLLPPGGCPASFLQALQQGGGAPCHRGWPGSSSRKTADRESCSDFDRVGAARPRAGWVLALGGRRRQRLGQHAGPVAGGAPGCAIEAHSGVQRVAGDAAGDGNWWRWRWRQSFLSTSARKGNVGEVGRRRFANLNRTCVEARGHLPARPIAPSRCLPHRRNRACLAPGRRPAGLASCNLAPNRWRRQVRGRRDWPARSLVRLKVTPFSRCPWEIGADSTCLA